MPVIEEGEPGRSVRDSSWGGRSAARRGAYFERVSAAALRYWLERRPDTTYLFHDICDLQDVPGFGKYKPLRLGGTNLDHVVLSAGGWLLLDSKGCGAGTLCVENGTGLLLKQNGTRVRQPWMDDQRAYSKAGAMFRLTRGKPGVLLVVVPDNTEVDPSVGNARFAKHCTAIVSPCGIQAGQLDEYLTTDPAIPDPGDCVRIRARLTPPMTNVPN